MRLGLDLSVEDASRVASLLTRTMLVSHLYAIRMEVLLAGLLELFDAKLVTAGMFSPIIAQDKPNTVHIHDGCHAGKLTPQEQAAMYAYFADMLSNPDPAHVAVVSAFANSHENILVLRHQDIVAHDGPAWQHHARTVRHPCGLDGEFFLARRMCKPDIWAGITLHRAIDKPLFSDRDVAVARIIIENIGDVFETKLRERKGLDLLADAPPRLRQTLAGLLRGGSEKTVAAELSISIHTVHEHIKRLHKLFQVASRGELLSACQSARITPESVESLSGNVKPLRHGDSAKRAMKDFTRAEQKQPRIGDR